MIPVKNYTSQEATKQLSVVLHDLTESRDFTDSTLVQAIQAIRSYLGESGHEYPVAPPARHTPRVFVRPQVNPEVFSFFEDWVDKTIDVLKPEETKVAGVMVSFLYGRYLDHHQATRGPVSLASNEKTLKPISRKNFIQALLFVLSRKHDVNHVQVHGQRDKVFLGLNYSGVV